MSERMALGGLVLAPASHRHPQAELAARFRRALECVPGSERVRKTAAFVHESAGIDAREIEAGFDELDVREDWIRLVNGAAFSMAERAVGAAIERAGIGPDDVDALIVASSVYVGFPSLTRRLQGGLGLPADLLAYDLAGLGCAAPTHALHLAGLLVERGAARTAAVVCTDAMGTHGACRRFTAVPTMSEVIAHVLASDGAAAVIVGRDLPRPELTFELGPLLSRLWEGALDQNDLGAGPDNQPFLSVGKDIKTRLLDEVGAVIDEELLEQPFIMHPGGLALTQALGRSHPRLKPWADLATSVLVEHGNVGAASLLYVLRRVLDQGPRLTGDPRLFALGPGITTTVLTLREVQPAASGAAS